MKNHTSIEPLETRIAPAAIFTFTDVDGDRVTVKTSKGTNADLAAVITTSTPAGSVAGGKSLDTINLAMNLAAFDGTDLSVTAKPGPLGGDGLVNVVRIAATGLDLGTVKIGGDLADLDAGKNNITSKIKIIDVQSTSGAATWNLNANVGTLKVARDLRGAEISMPMSGATLGTLQIGGSLIGESETGTGYVDVPIGTIGKVIIKGDIVGGANIKCGAIVAKDILSVVIGGNVLGSSGAASGEIFGTNSIGSVKIKGDVRGGTEVVSGFVHSDGKLGNVTIGGSLIGGNASFSGTIKGANGIGKVTIGRDVRGGSSNDTGNIQSVGGGIAGVKIGGSIHGGAGTKSGYIFSGGTLGPVTLGGGLFGGDGDSSGAIRSTSVAGPVKIGRDVVGGAGGSSGAIVGEGGITSVTIGGDLIGGSSGNTGYIGTSTGGNIGPVKIGGSIIGSTGATSAGILSFGKIGNITIGGDILGGSGASAGFISSNNELGAVKIGGSLVGASISAASGQLTIKSISIGGRVERADIFSASADAQIGPIKVGGDWIASSVLTGIDQGADNVFGTADDAVTSGGNPALFSKIASITIGGQVRGTVGGTDHFGFVSQEIGSLKIHGVKVPLTAGRGNDIDVNNTRFILGATRDVTVHEVL